MPTPHFHFKKFTICHDRSSMKVGTDGVLLGAWAGQGLDNELSPKTILDIGTGSGLIALMLAQRFESSHITAIDIHEESVAQAQENAMASSFGDRIEVSLQDFSTMDINSNRYDLIVSNPPFYTEDTLSGKESRDNARHTSALPFDALISGAASLLNDKGLFSVIIPYSSVSSFVFLCTKNRLHLLRRMDVKSTEKKDIKRSLLEFGKQSKPTQTATITLYAEGGLRSAEYAKLTKEFYL